MAKIALLLSGHTRSLKYTINNLAEVIEALKCDVFTHTWSEAEMSSSTWRQPDFYHEESFEGNLIQSLSPLGFMIEPQSPILLKLFKNSIHQDVSLEEKSISGSHFMLYGMNKVFQLMEEYELEKKINYKVIIRYRYDLVCKNIASLKDDVNKASAGTTIMADHNWANILEAKFDGVIIAERSKYEIFLREISNCYNNIYQLSTGLGGILPELIITKIMGSSSNILNSNSEFNIVRSNNFNEQIFKIRKVSYRNMIASSVSYLNFSLKNRESYKSFNNFIWHENTIFINRFISYIIFILIGEGKVYRRVFFPVKNIFIKNKYAYEKAFRI